jgi:hypothetical protein
VEIILTCLVYAVVFYIYISRNTRFIISCLHLFSLCFGIVLELQHLRNCLPDQVVVQRIDERLSALGNCVACNDHVALTHPDLDKVCLSL